MRAAVADGTGAIRAGVCGLGGSSDGSGSGDSESGIGGGGSGCAGAADTGSAAEPSVF